MAYHLRLDACLFMENTRQKGAGRTLIMARTKIYEKDIFYSWLKPCVDWCCRHSYNTVEVGGYENIPDDGAVIIAPNHCNTLMDALVILRSFKDESVFGARADMFKNPLIAKAMFFLRILPMVRQRDGLRNVLKNYETIDIITETLEHGIRFCMYPEGRHRPAHSLLPLGKGVMRAAIAANEAFGNRKPIYIVPTGIEYGDYFRYRSTCLITFGKAINVTEFIKELDVETEAQMMDPLRKELRKRISELITYIPDDENYESKWALTRILAREDARQGKLSERLIHNRNIISLIEESCIKEPEKMKKILADATSFDKERRKKGLSIWSFGNRNTASNAVIKGLIALLGIPYFIFAAIASLPMWVTFELLRGKLKDRAFHNTAGFGIKLAMGPLIFIMWTILAFSLTSWPVAILLSLLTIPAYSFFYDYTDFTRIFISDLKLLNNKKMNDWFKAIISDFSKI